MILISVEEEREWICTSKKIVQLRGGWQTFYVEDVGDNEDVDGEEEDVSEANILVSEASKPSAGARIFKGP